MGFPRIVCPDSEAVLQGFTGRAVALRVKGWDRIASGVELVRRSGNLLFGVIVESDRPLADMEFDDRHQGAPLAVMAPSLGRFRDLARHLHWLTTLNRRVYLPCGHPENLTSLRILSSLGITCGADFRDGNADWESLADLATYALLERAPHAAIEPFAFIAANYPACRHLDWGRVFFDDPRHFLHLDACGRVALSRADLAQNRFAAQSLDEIEVPAEFGPIRDRLRAWQDFFIDSHACASCAGWRICLGKFSGDRAANAGCAEFFTEMIDLVHRHTNAPVVPEERRLWQP